MVVYGAFTHLLFAAFVPLDVLVNLTSMGTLIAFAIVSLGVIILRRTQPDLPRGYKVPLYPLLPIASVAFCGYLIIGLPLDTFTLAFAVARMPGWVGHIREQLAVARLVRPEAEYVGPAPRAFAPLAERATEVVQ